MTTVNLTDPIFSDEDAAREHLESIRWPNGPFCPHCGETERVTRLHGDSHRPGLFQCNSCREHFTVMVGSVMERSHIPLPKWVLGFHLMAASKKGISAHQLHRMLGVTYKSAWFMAMRIRESMRELAPNEHGPLGGEGKVVEVDETYVGGKARNQKGKVPPKEAVVALVERDGSVRSHHVPEVTAKTLRPILVSHIDRKSYLMTDESLVYPTVGREFSGHGTVNHSIEEYVRTGGFHHTNTVEGYFAILKRGIIGTYHHVSQYHLKRYLGEFDFRYNERIALGVDDTERAAKAIKGGGGKRLTYRQPHGRDEGAETIPF
jgi:transposase-like protein